MEVDGETHHARDREVPRTGPARGWPPAFLVRGRVSSMTEGADRGGRSPRFPAIEGIRALAALGIVAYHVGELGLTQGPLERIGLQLRIGVPVFFVVSAFVLYRPFVAGRSDGATAPRLGPFLLRRAVRIVPLYWLLLTVVWWTSPLFSALPRSELFAGVPWWRFYLFTQVYDEASYVAGLGPAWTLNVEMAFYLALPVWAALVAWLVRRGVPRHVELVVLGLVAVLGTRHLRELELAASYRAASPQANACYFAIGMALAVLSADLGRDRPMVVARAVRSVAPFAAPVLALVLGVFLFRADLRHAEWVRFAAVSLVLVPAAFDPRPRTVLKRILLQRHLQVMGVLSYGIYLFHRQIALALRLWFWSPMDKYDFLVAFGIVVALTVLLAHVSFRYLEHPLMRAAGRVGRRGHPAPVERAPS